ncbi:hypothetical protein TNCV_4106271 [Trichonephila clavipes]|nr:hypothetical protein TNCV_4106271 [Trichonephila clavipes]
MMGPLLPSSDRNLSQHFWFLSNKDYHVDVRGFCNTQCLGRATLTTEWRRIVFSDESRFYWSLMVGLRRRQDETKASVKHPTVSGGRSPKDPE